MYCTCIVYLFPCVILGHLSHSNRRNLTCEICDLATWGLMGGAKYAKKRPHFKNFLLPRMWGKKTICMVMASMKPSAKKRICM